MDADAPPAKRRRTSPRLSKRANSTEPPLPDAAPNSRANSSGNGDANHHTTTTTTPPDAPATADGAGDGTRSRPPSFASPTRASLARHNPAILECRPSVPRQDNNSNGSDAGALLDEPRNQGSAENDREADVRPLARSPVRSPVRSLARSPTRPLAQPALKSPVRLSRSPSRSPTRRLFAGGDKGNGSVAGSLLGEPPRRSPVKPVPRPLPPPDPQRSQDLLEPLVARDRQRAGLDQFRSHEETQPDPELPPTPDHVDPSTLHMSPPGIHHSSTPSKRPRRAVRAAPQKAKPGTALGSSPLKPTAATGDAEAPDASQDDAGTKAPARRRGRPRKTEPARNIQPTDPEAAQKRERDSLQAEIAALEADLALAAAENARIREAAEAGADDRASADPAVNQRELISLLRRHAFPETDDADETPTTSAPMRATLDWLQAATNPVALLPFAKHGTAMGDLLQLGGDPAAGVGGAEEALPPPASHHPIEMTAAEELPFLQAFTPLAFRSEIVVLASDAPATAATLQKHTIMASSTTPPGVFVARIEMTVHSSSLRVTDLAVPRIEPPAAAAELQPLICRVTSDQNGSSALTRNVTVLTWAMGEWVRVAVRRAKFWAVLARKLRGKAGLDDGDGTAGLVEELRQQRATERKRKRRRGPADADADANANADEGQGGSREEGAAGGHRTTAVSVSPTELLEHLGRTAMDVEVSGSASLRVEWAIEFDWTGEASSQMRLLVGVPGKWRKADTRGRLARLPKLFDELVQDSDDPMAAVQTAVALLAGEEGV